MENNKSGITFMSALGLLFVGLKLTGNIDWSWWWVLAPFWSGVALVVIVLVVAFVFAIISSAIDNARNS